MAYQKQKIRNIIIRFESELKKLNINPQKIVLFGSYARGKAREDSDIDLVVISDDFKKLNLRERLEILGLAGGRILEPVEALGYTPEEIKNVNPISILNEALRTGIVVK